MLDFERLAALSRSGKAFYGGDAATAAASNYGHVQLINPAASGKVVVVRRAAGLIGVNGAVYLSRWSTAVGSNSTNPANKVEGGAAPSAQVRTYLNTSITGAVHMVFNLLANQPFEFLRFGPVILDQGVGIIIAGGAVNAVVGGNFEWEEYGA
jgi:hypothetical protein